MMAHTPGPWYANDECIECAGPEGPRDVTLAVVTHSEDAHADARLIAAAPALLEACDAAARWLDGDIGDSNEVIAEQGTVLHSLLMRALDKAEGRVP